MSPLAGYGSLPPSLFELWLTCRLARNDDVAAPRLTRYEGRCARHERAVGCGGRDGALDETHLSRTAKSCGPGAPVLALSSQQQELLRVTVARKPVTGESAK